MKTKGAGKKVKKKGKGEKENDLIYKWGGGDIYPCVTATTCTWFCLVRPATPSILTQKAEAPATDCSFFSSRFFRAACFLAYTIDCTLPCIIGREIR